MSITMRKTFLLSALMACALSAYAVQDVAIPDDAIGLSKSSVYEDPDPIVVNYRGGDVGTNKRAQRSYHTAPPMITHTIVDMVPIRQDFNLCKDCHVQPDLLKEKITQGMPVPAPVSHYANVKKGEMHMARWNCVQCHAPQADVKTLVNNTFRKAR